MPTNEEKKLGQDVPSPTVTEEVKTSETEAAALSPDDRIRTAEERAEAEVRADAENRARHANLPRSERVARGYETGAPLTAAQRQADRELAREKAKADVDARKREVEAKKAELKAAEDAEKQAEKDAKDASKETSKESDNK